MDGLEFREAVATGEVYVLHLLQLLRLIPS
jgi:hypothetical protein